MTGEANHMMPSAFGFWVCTFTWTVLSLLVFVAVTLAALPAEGNDWNPYVAGLTGVWLAALIAPLSFGVACLVGFLAWVWALWRVHGSRSKSI